MSDASTRDKIGFMGLGNMGWPMAGHLQEAGADLIVWNRSAARREEAVSHGIAVADSPAALAAAVGGGILALNLTHAPVVRSLVEEAAPHLSPGALVIDFGTTGYDETLALAAELEARGVAWLDAPVSGGEVGARNGNLTIMAGGSEESFARALPVLRIVGETITHVGGTGAGQVAKLANQLIVAQTIDAVAQALRLAELAGVDAARVREALRGGFAESRILDLHGDRMVRRDFAPGGRSELQLKDVRLICELAERVGLQSGTLEQSRRQWERFVHELGHGDLDHSGLFKVYEPA